MSKRIKQTGKKSRRVRSISRTLPKVDAELVAKRLGARKSDAPEIGQTGDAPSTLRKTRED